MASKLSREKSRGSLTKNFCKNNHETVCTLNQEHFTVIDNEIKNNIEGISLIDKKLKLLNIKHDKEKIETEEKIKKLEEMIALLNMKLSNSLKPPRPSTRPLTTR